MISPTFNFTEVVVVVDVALHVGPVPLVAFEQLGTPGARG